MAALTTQSRHLADLVAQAMDRAGEAVALFRDAPGDPKLADCNEAMIELTGRTAASLRGASVFDVLGLVGNQAECDQLSAAFASGRVAQGEVSGHRRDGRGFWLGYRMMPASDGQYVLLGRDVTDRRLAQQQQQAAQALLARIFQVIDAAVAIAGLDGTVLMANPRLHELLDRPSGSLAGKPGLDLVAEPARAAVTASLLRQQQDGKPFTLETSILCGPGEPLPVRMNSVLVVRSDLQRVCVYTLTPTGGGQGSGACGPRFAVAGKLQLVGLEEVRSALGTRWPEMSERVMQTAEHVVRQRIGPSDSFSRTNDDGLLICFGGLTEDEAAFRSAMLGREIRQKLIGLGNDTTAARVTAIAAAVAIPEHADAAALPRLLEERLGARRVEIEGRARDTLRATVQGTRCEFDVVQSRDGRTIAHLARLPPATEQRVVAAAGALPADEMDDFDIDVLRLTLSAERAAEMAAAGVNLPVMVEIGFAVFETRGRLRRLLDACARLPAGFREQLTLILCDRPEGLAEARLRDCLQRLRPYCRELGFASDILELPPAAAGPAPALMVVPLGAMLTAGTLREETLFHFLPGLHGRGARLLVRDVLSRGMTNELREMGVDLIALRPAA